MRVCPAPTPGKISGWDPYGQNDHSEWFDAEYMFDVAGGFDVVIGNPPYVQLQKDGGRLGKLYRNAGYATFASTGDLYQLFYEQGLRLLSPSGHLALITSNSWLKAEYGKATRKHMAQNLTVLRLLEMGKDVFDNVIVDTSVLLGRSGNSAETGKAVDMDRLSSKAFPPDEKLWSDFSPRGESPWSVLSSIEQDIMDKMVAKGTPLKDWDIAINYGIKTGYNDAFIIDNQTKDALVAQDQRSKEIIKPVLRGKDIQRFRAKWADMWIIDTHNGYDGVPAIKVDDYPCCQGLISTPTISSWRNGTTREELPITSVTVLTTKISPRRNCSGLNLSTMAASPTTTADSTVKLRRSYSRASPLNTCARS